MDENFLKVSMKKNIGEKSMDENLVKSMGENFVKVWVKEDRRKKYG